MIKNFLTRLIGPKAEKKFVEDAKAAEAKAVDPLDPIARTRPSPFPEAPKEVEVKLRKASDFPTFDGLAGEAISVGDSATSVKVMDDSTGGDYSMALKGGGYYGVPEALNLWYASQGFIGYQACAIIAQHWLVDKACSMAGEDAVRNGWYLTSEGGEDLQKDVYDKVNSTDKEFKIKENLVEFNRFKNVFGIRVAIFKVKSTDPLYYEKPFNIDGVAADSYEGISQVDPYWMTPVLSSNGANDPSQIGFYEPQYWVINGKKYHISHLAISRGPQPADILKPTYIFGGVSLVQRIYERVYAAERTANEAPLMAMSKRTMAIHADLDKIMANQCEFEERLALWIRYRDNHGVKVLGTEEAMEQFDTVMSDFDSIIMNQYQIVAAIARTPATKLLGTSPKGFNATGEFESKSYHEELESIQEHVMMPMLERHYQILARSLGIKTEIGIVCNPVDSVSTKERADLNKIKSDMGVAYINAGVISPEEERSRLQDDEHSGYDRLRDDISAETEPGMSPENLADLEKAGAAKTAAENPAATPGGPTPPDAAPGQQEHSSVASPATLQALIPVLLQGVVSNGSNVDPAMAALLLLLAKATMGQPAANDAPSIRSVQPSVRGSTMRSISAQDAEVVRQMAMHKMPKMKLNGLNLVIENPRGTVRCGTDLDGTEWAQEMPDHYGFIKGYMGADGQDVDCFIGPNLRCSEVYVIAQKCPETGEFDEYKCMIGYDSPEHAEETYHRSYGDDWSGFDHMQIMSWDEFHSWLNACGGEMAPTAMLSMEDDAEFKESEHKRDKSGKFSSTGGGTSPSVKPTKNMGSSPKGLSKKDALPKLAHEMIAANGGKAPTPEAFHEAVTKAGFVMVPAQSVKYMKMAMKEKKEGSAPSAAAAASVAPTPATAAKVEAAVSQPTTVKQDHKTETAELAKAGGMPITTMIGNAAVAQGYPKEGTWSGIDYYKAADGTKASYKAETDTWMVQDANKKVIAQGAGAMSMLQHLSNNKKEATAAAKPTPPAAPVHDPSTEGAKAYGHAIPAEKFSFSSKGIANEKALPPKVRDAIKAYKGSSYKMINEAMRYKDSFDPDTVSAQTMAHILNLQRAFAQVAPSQKDAVVGRKIGVDALKGMLKDAGIKSLDDLKEGMVIRESGVVSTSHSEHVWSGKVRLEIKVPKGSKAIDISETVKINQSEDEVLLSPDSKFKVGAVKKGHKGYDYHIECELIKPQH